MDGRPLEAGVPAPDFTLTMVETEQPVSLADYRGKSPLLLGLYRMPRDPSGELLEALPLWEATKALGRLDGFKPTDTDREDGRRTWDQSVGEFPIDRDGIVRWLYLEGTTATEYMAKFSSEEELVSAARALVP